MSRASIKSGKELLDYIPQRPPFVMVDRLFQVTENAVESGFTVETSNQLVENGKFQASGLIENMAQTCALFAGYRAQEMDKEAPVGFIASIKDVAIQRLPATGESINTRIEIVNELMNMQIARAVVKSQAEEILAGCELRIFIKEDE